MFKSGLIERACVLSLSFPVRVDLCNAVLALYASIRPDRVDDDAVLFDACPCVCFPSVPVASAR